MNDTDSLLGRIDRSARSIARLSAGTKVIASVMLGIALIMLMYAFVQAADDRTSDFVGFGITSVGIAALALVFMSVAAFHTAFGDAMRLAVQVHLNIEHLARSQEQKARKAAAGTAPAAPPPAPLPEGPPPALDAPAAAVAPPAAAVAPPAEQPPAQPAMKACPTCHKSIRADVTRCRYCMERV